MFFDICFCIDLLLTFWSKNCSKWTPKIDTGLSFFVPIIGPGAQIDFWMHVGRPLVPFWLLFVSLWLTFSSLWLLFAFLFTSFASFWFPFGSPARFGPLLFFWLAVGSLLLPFRSLLIQLSFVFFSLSLHFTLSQSFECETCSTVLF